MDRLLYYIVCTICSIFCVSFDNNRAYGLHDDGAFMVSLDVLQFHSDDGLIQADGNWCTDISNITFEFCVGMSTAYGCRGRTLTYAAELNATSGAMTSNTSKPLTSEIFSVDEWRQNETVIAVKISHGELISEPVFFGPSGDFTFWSSKQHIVRLQRNTSLTPYSLHVAIKVWCRDDLTGPDCNITRQNTFCPDPSHSLRNQYDCQSNDTLFLRLVTSSGYWYSKLFIHTRLAKFISNFACPSSFNHVSVNIKHIRYNNSSSGLLIVAFNASCTGTAGRFWPVLPLKFQQALFVRSIEGCHDDVDFGIPVNVSVKDITNITEPGSIKMLMSIESVYKPGYPVCLSNNTISDSSYLNTSLCDHVVEICVNKTGNQQDCLPVRMAKWLDGYGYMTDQNTAHPYTVSLSVNYSSISQMQFYLRVHYWNESKSYDIQFFNLGYEHHVANLTSIFPSSAILSQDIVDPETRFSIHLQATAWCKRGYGGQFCRMRNSDFVEECKGTGIEGKGFHCQQGGSCCNGTCHCPEGFSGMTCRTELDECQFGFCLNGASCTNIPGSYTCTCLPGYTGQRCNVYENECTSNPCHRRGTCFDNHRINACPFQTHGSGKSYGNRPTVLNLTCPNERVYRPDEHGFSYECHQDFTRSICSISMNTYPINNTNPCLNDGRCSLGITGFACECAVGFTGTNCSTSIDPCLTNNHKQCLNGGTLMSNNSKCVCVCATGLTGSNCSTFIDPCLTNNPKPCLNGGTLMSNNSECVCECATGFTGSNCSTFIDPCLTNHPKQCLNGGTLMSNNSECVCECATGFTGSNCSTSIHYLSTETNSCLNGSCSSNTTKSLTDSFPELFIYDMNTTIDITRLPDIQQSVKGLLVDRNICSDVEAINVSTAVHLNTTTMIDINVECDGVLVNWTTLRAVLETVNTTTLYKLHDHGLRIQKGQENEESWLQDHWTILVGVAVGVVCSALLTAGAVVLVKRRNKVFADDSSDTETQLVKTGNQETGSSTSVNDNSSESEVNV